MSPGGHTKIAALLAAAALSGCAGNGKGLDANGNPIGPGGGSTGPLTADFQSIQDNVFTPICTKCHIGAGAPEGLQLDQAHSYSLLVNVPSTEQPNVLRVSPGKPDMSYIVLKLQGSPGISGVRMPFGGPYLPQSTIDVIRQWITNGAQKAAAANAMSTAKLLQPFTVAAASPDPGSVATVVPLVAVAFSSDIDPSLVNDTTVRLVKLNTAPGPESGPDSSPMPPMGAMSPMNTGFSAGATRVAVSLTVPAGDPSALLITPRTPLGSGIYRVTLAASLADMNARALGADYSLQFTVDQSP